MPFAVVRQVFGASSARSFVAFHVVGRFVVRRVAGAKNGVSVAHVALVPSVQAIVFVTAVGGKVGHVRWRFGEDGTEDGVCPARILVQRRGPVETFVFVKSSNILIPLGPLCCKRFFIDLADRLLDLCCATKVDLTIG